MASITPLHPLPQMPEGFDPQPVWEPPTATLLELVWATAASTGTVLGRPVVSWALAQAFGGGARRHRTDPRPTDTDDGDVGWFGPSSVAWKVQADTSMFVAGITAFTLQLLHPLALAGVVEHSSFADDFLGRVQRTGEFLQGVTYGSGAEATRRCAQVRRVHQRVVGTAPDGRPYDAADPALLEWVHLGEYLAIAAAYRRFGAWSLSDTELDAYIAEVAVVAGALAVPDPPRSWAALDAALQRHRPALAVNEQTRSALRFLMRPPGLPAAARPMWRVAWAGSTACLPPWARRILGIADPSAAELVACRSLVRSLGALAGKPPPLVAAEDRLGLAETG
jgi:uncharacterized protein (DUF2236 family)